MIHPLDLPTAAASGVRIAIVDFVDFKVDQVGWEFVSPVIRILQRTHDAEVLAVVRVEYYLVVILVQSDSIFRLGVPKYIYSTHRDELNLEVGRCQLNRVLGRLAACINAIHLLGRYPLEQRWRCCVIQLDWSPVSFEHETEVGELERFRPAFCHGSRVPSERTPNGELERRTNSSILCRLRSSPRRSARKGGQLWNQIEGALACNSHGRVRKGLTMFSQVPRKRDHVVEP